MGNLKLTGVGTTANGVLGGGDLQLTGDQRPPEPTLNFQGVVPAVPLPNLRARLGGFDLRGVVPAAPVGQFGFGSYLQGVVPAAPAGVLQVTPGQALTLRGVVPAAPAGVLQVALEQTLALRGVVPAAPVGRFGFGLYLRGVVPAAPAVIMTAQAGAVFTLRGVVPAAPVAVLEAVLAGAPLNFRGVVPAAPAGFGIPSRLRLRGVVPAAPAAVFSLEAPPSADVGRALVVNLTTGAATRYEQFRYRRLFQAGSRVLGVVGQDLEHLFSGAAAPWSIRTGQALISDERVAIIDSVYLHIQGNGTVGVTITYDEDHPDENLARLSQRAGFDVVRTKAGKGVRGHAADIRLSGETAVKIRSLGLRVLGKGRKL